MAGGLVALLDDVAAIARMAAASVDDVAAGVSKTTAKAAGVVIDDAAVTPQYIAGASPARELPIIWRIARGSLFNKLIIITPLVLLMSAFVPVLLTPLLMLGGTYLCYEGAHKVWEKISGHAQDAAERTHEIEQRDAKDEKAVVRSAILTDFILSTEIMVISLNEVIDLDLMTRTLILIGVAIVITVAVYGAVAFIVKMDDIGLHLIEENKSPKVGSVLVHGMPKVLQALTIIGTLAMLWVGGHILVVGADDLGFHLPYAIAHGFGGMLAVVPFLGGALAWLGETLISMFVGLIWGGLIVAVLGVLPFSHKH